MKLVPHRLGRQVGCHAREVATHAEIQQALASDGIDGVLFINVGDSGVSRQYAGTILSGQYSGSSSIGGTVNNYGNVSTVSLNGTSSGTMTATATPTYRYSRQTAFTALR